LSRYRLSVVALRQDGQLAFCAVWGSRRSPSGAALARGARPPAYRRRAQRGKPCAGCYRHGTVNGETLVRHELNGRSATSTGRGVASGYRGRPRVRARDVDLILGFTLNDLPISFSSSKPYALCISQKQPASVIPKPARVSSRSLRECHPEGPRVSSRRIMKSASVIPKARECHPEGATRVKSASVIPKC
jgi:hypothetical protein